MKETGKDISVSGSVLKIVAVVTMIVDHIALLLLEPSKSPESTFFIMRTVGRMAFPIFAFLLVEGFVYTSDRKKYLLRLLVTGILAECFWQLNGMEGHNVMFTLSIGLLALMGIEGIIKDDEKWTCSMKKSLSVTGILIVGVIISELLQVDYTARGFLTVVMFYLCRDMPVMAVAGVMTILILPLEKFGGTATAMMLILLYNHTRGFVRGKKMQYAFYAIYPAQFAIFYLIRLITQQ